MNMDNIKTKKDMQALANSKGISLAAKSLKEMKIEYYQNVLQDEEPEQSLLAELVLNTSTSTSTVIVGDTNAVLILRINDVVETLSRSELQYWCIEHNMRPEDVTSIIDTGLTNDGYEFRSTGHG